MSNDKLDIAIQYLEMIALCEEKAAHGINVKRMMRSMAIEALSKLDCTCRICGATKDAKATTHPNTGGAL